MIAAKGAAMESVGGLLGWAGRVVRRALRIVAELMDPKAWGKAHNYIEFFFTLLGSERTIFDRLRAGYGESLPPMRFAHFMMDMQLAYKAEKPPHYPVYTVQMQRMAQLQRDSDGQLIGFWAFDPRRPDWREWAKAALDAGFSGFKFYPAMGYKPDGDATHGAVIDAFLDFCVEGDHPVFAHCTPEGFQTREKEGHFANPIYWEAALCKRPALRLCLGHAGGGDQGEGAHRSLGWSASTEDEWFAPDNYASRVVRLCRRFNNVYCETGHLVELLEDEGRQRFIENLARANHGHDTCSFMHKMAYGTDWHMHAMVRSTRRFYEGFVQMFRHPDLEPYAERFFWMNAHAYLKLPI